MTHPTKALAPILLEDFRRLVVERRGEAHPEAFFTLQSIKDCMQRVTPLSIHETKILDDLEVRPYYAGHVLGAAMFYVRVPSTGESVLYTGDYNMTPDRHLGAARTQLRLRPDLLITESTYATTLRDSKRARERDFLRNIHQCVAGGGKVLIPVFALGRVQELCILVEGYWKRMAGLSTVPIYFSAGMAEMANAYYRVFTSYTNEHLQETARGTYAGELALGERSNPFDFAYVRPWERHYVDHPGPMVLFSSPGMLHSGTSLEVFKRWCGDERNLLIIPGFCVSGTVGARLLAGQRIIPVEEINPQGEPIQRTLNVRMAVKSMSFSAHADARGIMQLIRVCEPRHVVLVHGEAAKMAILKGRIEREMGLPCWDPPNGQIVEMESGWQVPVTVKSAILNKVIDEHRSLIERLAFKGVGGQTDDGMGGPDAGTGEEDHKLAALMTLAKERAKSHLSLRNLTIEWDEREAQTGLLPRLSLGGDGGEGRESSLADVLVEANLGRSLAYCEQDLQRSLQRHLLHMGIIEEVILDEIEHLIQVRSFSLSPSTGDIKFRLMDYKLAQECVSFLG